MELRVLPPTCPNGLIGILRRSSPVCQPIRADARQQDPRENEQIDPFSTILLPVLGRARSNRSMPFASCSDRATGIHLCVHRRASHGSARAFFLRLALVARGRTTPRPRDTSSPDRVKAAGLLSDHVRWCDRFSVCD